MQSASAASAPTPAAAPVQRDERERTWRRLLITLSPVYPGGKAFSVDIGPLGTKKVEIRLPAAVFKLLARALAVGIVGSFPWARELVTWLLNHIR